MKTKLFLLTFIIYTFVSCTDNDCTYGPECYPNSIKALDLEDNSVGRQVLDYLDDNGSNTCILNYINFLSGSAILSSFGAKELDDLAVILNNFIEINISIEGHTDSQGSEEGNQTLSDDRAKSVLDYLISKDVQKSQLVSIGYGETRPITTNETALGRSKNRRVEIVVSK